MATRTTQAAASPTCATVFPAPAGPFQGTVPVPGDKSISQRAAILAAVAAGESVLTGYLPSEDCRATLRALGQLGVESQWEAGTPVVHVHSPGWEGWRESEDVLDLGNSGTGFRLLTGILAAFPAFSVLTGDASLRRRPMGRVVDPLRRMGARIWGRSDGRFAPLAVQGTYLVGQGHLLPVASAQVKSALLLAGLFARGQTQIEEPAPSRDHTERLLTWLGLPVEPSKGRRVRVEGVWAARKVKLSPFHLTIPADPSSAAFFWALAALRPGSRVTVPGVGINPTRIAFLHLLEKMGAGVSIQSERMEGGEPVADVSVEGRELRGLTVGGATIPAVIDELPLLAVLASQAQGRTQVQDAAELRVKESDRIHGMAEQLGHLGVEVEEKEDGWVIDGPQTLQGGQVESLGDHRVAMSLAIAAVQARQPVTISGIQWVDTSFPGFFERLCQFTHVEVGDGSGDSSMEK
ncbi:MAG: 3-phosphoshikimate 1-carboxyvinyltransferase [Limnochordaceae bacterium]|nr:3-phosphoshikimate 1-carboxyvinyltransferase [Limnochordaceae bacterium]